MAFELLPHLTLWLGGFALVALAGLTLTVGAVAEATIRNRRVRLARHQSMRSYYGRHLVPGH